MQANKKTDWNILLTAIMAIATVISVIVAVISVIVAVAAIYQSQRSLLLAQEANRISLAAQLPQIQINRLFRFQAYVDDFKRPCKLTFSNGAGWYIESANGFDITNTGGKAISLVGIKGQEIEMFARGIRAKVDYDVFGTKEAFDEWFSVRPSPSQLFITDQKYTKFDFSGLPTKIEPGETKRLLLLGKHSVSFDETYKTSEDVQKALAGSNWNAQVIFSFGDGTTITQLVPITYPYQFDPPLVPHEFEQCSQ